MFGETPLHHAAGSASLQIVRILLERGADASAINCMEQTPLHYAAFLQTTRVLELLLRHKANFRIKNIYGQPALHTALLRKNTPAVRLLLDAGADANSQDKQGQTPITLAVAWKDHASARLLISRGANPNPAGHSLLFDPLVRNELLLVKILLQGGANPNAQTFSNMTPLHLAMNRDWPELTQLLIEKGADAGAGASAALNRSCPREEAGALMILESRRAHGSGRCAVTPTPPQPPRGFSLRTLPPGAY